MGVCCDLHDRLVFDSSRILLSGKSILTHWKSDRGQRENFAVLACFLRAWVFLILTD